MDKIKEEIQRLEEAISKTKSPYLKRDCTKRIEKLKKKLKKENQYDIRRKL